MTGNKYLIWKIMYTYKAFCVDGEHNLKNSYVIIAKDQAEALKKADERFSYSNLNKELVANGKAYDKGVELSDLCKNAHEYQKNIEFPKLTLEDNKKFKIKAEIKSDGQTLEFIVEEK